MNIPTRWDSNSVQDAALFVIMNLAAQPASREQIRMMDGVHVLRQITEYKNSHVSETFDESGHGEFQRLKAVSDFTRVLFRF